MRGFWIGKWLTVPRSTRRPTANMLGIGHVRSLYVGSNPRRADRRPVSPHFRKELTVEADPKIDAAPDSLGFGPCRPDRDVVHRVRSTLQIRHGDGFRRTCRDITRANRFSHSAYGARVGPSCNSLRVTLPTYRLLRRTVCSASVDLSGDNIDEAAAQPGGPASRRQSCCWPKRCVPADDRRRSARPTARTSSVSPVRSTTVIRRA